MVTPLESEVARYSSIDYINLDHIYVYESQVETHK